MLKMRSYLLSAWLLLVLLLAFVLEPVGAMAAEIIQATNTLTPTRTPTFQPLFSTPTPREWDSVCPTALPGGWLTETPSGFWSAACSHCLLTLTPTSTPQATATLLPSQIPPTAVPTATPSSAAGEWEYVHIPDQAGSSAVEDYLVYNAALREGNIIGVVINYSSLGSPSGLWARWIYYSYGTSQKYQASFDNYSQTHPLNKDIALIYYDQNNVEADPVNTHQQNLDAFVLENPDVLIYSPIVVGDIPMQPYTGHPAQINLGMYQQGGSGFVFTYTIKGYVVVDVEPGPVADYCGTVNPVESDLQAFNEMLPSPMVGQPTCWGMEEIVIPLSDVPFFGWDDISLPLILICFEPISMGSITVLGVDINLDSIIFVIGAVAVLLWFLRS